MDTADHIEELVKTASFDHSIESEAALHRALDSAEVYYRVTASVVDGKRLMGTPLLRLQDDTHAMLVYTSKSHPGLPPQFAGAPWRDTLEIAFGIPEADWVIVANLAGNWVATHRSQIPEILNGLPSRPSEPSNDSPYRESAETAAGTLDSLISNAVHTTVENRSAPILEELKGRKLYVPLAAELSEDGQPVMITSKVRDIEGLVQAYTSRSRPGITYGGMTWETIVEMIENAPELPGVHLINVNDDWVVLDRSNIKPTKPN